MAEWQWALLRLEHPVRCPNGSMVIGSRLDTDIKANVCRIAFYGRVELRAPGAPPLRVFHPKERSGTVERVVSGGDGTGQCEVIGKGLFKKGTPMAQFAGMRVETDGGARGAILGAFGKSGKFKVQFEPGAPVAAGARIVLRFKKFVFGPDEERRRMAQ